MNVLVDISLSCMSAFRVRLYPFLFVLLAVAFVGQAQSTRQNRTQMIAMAFVVAALFRGGGLALNNMVSLNTSLAPLMYLLPALGIALALWMIVRNEHPRPGLSVGDRIESSIGRSGWPG